MLQIIAYYYLVTDVIIAAANSGDEIVRYSVQAVLRVIK